MIYDLCIVQKEIHAYEDTSEVSSNHWNHEKKMKMKFNSWNVSHCLVDFDDLLGTKMMQFQIIRALSYKKTSLTNIGPIKPAMKPGPALLGCNSQAIVINYP